MEFIDDIATLESLYDKPGAASLRKVVSHITPGYRQWIERARYCILSTVGPDGTDGSPRGDDGPVVQILDDQTLALPDWHGNKRLDSLRNIVRDGRVSLLFMIPGSHNVIRINGQARLSADSTLRHRFARADSKLPTTVIVIRLHELYSQCARASLRADLWNRDDSAGLPSIGQLLAEATDGEEGGPRYDQQWAERARQSMW